MKRILTILSLYVVSCGLGWAEAPKVVNARAPYYCNGLQLKQSSKSPQGLRKYHFAGICQVKTPGYRQWIYKQVWLDIDATWDPKSNIASENAVVTVGGSGRVRLILKCEDDPWVSNSGCLVKEFTNSSEFDNFAARFKVRKKRSGAVVLANFPPLARFVATNKMHADPAKAAARPAVAMTDAHSKPAPSAAMSSNDTKKAAGQVVTGAALSSSAEMHGANAPKRILPAGHSNQARPHTKKQQTYHAPKIKGHRIAWCLRWGNHCGKAAADAFCQKMHFAHAKEWKIAYNVGQSLVMGDGRMCLHKSCSGFDRIVCESK